MNNLSKTIIAFLFVLSAFPIHAQIITDRPDQTESSSTVGNGNLQVESGFLIAYERDYYSTRQILAPSTLFRYGVCRTVELRLLSQFETFKRSNYKTEGFSDFELGTKIQILNSDKKNIKIAFLSHFIFPSGTKSLSKDEYGSINKLAFSHNLSENVALGYNIGYTFFDQDIGDLTYSLALGIAINDKVSVYIEPYGAYSEFEEVVINFDSGLTYLIKNNLQLDFSFGLGISHEMNYLSLGISWFVEKK